MTADDHAHSLDELAAAFGVTRRYHDGTGTPRRASDDAVVAVLKALGAPLDRIEDAAEACRAVAASPPRRTSVICAQAGSDVSTPVALRGLSAAGARVVLESGETLDAAVTASENGVATVTLPPGLPAGYHHIEHDGGDPSHAPLLLAAPPLLPQPPRSWGLFAPLYGLDDRERGAFATYGDLARLATWMTRGPRAGDRDVAFLGTLPLLACYFEEPFEPSPYSPISRAFWSELYVDPSAAPEARGLPVDVAGEPRATDGRIDYRTAMRQRRRSIEALLHHLDDAGGARRDALDAAIEADEDELARYAAFRAAVERHGSTWENWSGRARSGTLRAAADYDGEVFRYHAYAQWLAREQIAEAASSSPAGLYLDLPLGSHGGGYDTWRHAGEFAFGISAGAPPDAVFAGGQDWGFPPLHPARARESGYAALRAALRHHFAHAALLRVDHVMGLHRLFWIPAGFGAADGVYVDSHARETWSILAIEASRGRGGKGTSVIGEDLGTVPDEVRAEMTRRGALRMHVVPFECRDDAAAAIVPPPRSSLACLGTHDMEPFASWWLEDTTPRDAIAAFLGCAPDAASALEALLAWLARGDATLVCANLEDLWLETRRQNLPGTSADHGNWQRPFARSVADFAADGRVLALVALLRGAGTSGTEMADAARAEAAS